MDHYSSCLLLPREQLSEKFLAELPQSVVLPQNPLLHKLQKTLNYSLFLEMRRNLSSSRQILLELLHSVPSSILLLEEQSSILVVVPSAFSLERRNLLRFHRSQALHYSIHLVLLLQEKSKSMVTMETTEILVLLVSLLFMEKLFIQTYPSLHLLLEVELLHSLLKQKSKYVSFQLQLDLQDSLVQRKRNLQEGMGQIPFYSIFLDRQILLQFKYLDTMETTRILVLLVLSQFLGLLRTEKFKSMDTMETTRILVLLELLLFLEDHLFTQKYNIFQQLLVLDSSILLDLVNQQEYSHQLSDSELYSNFPAATKLMQEQLTSQLELLTSILTHKLKFSDLKKVEHM